MRAALLTEARGRAPRTVMRGWFVRVGPVQLHG